MNDEKLWKIVIALMRMVISAQKEAAIAQQLVRLASPSISDTEHLRVREETSRAYDALLRQIEQAPAADALKFLRDFQGPIQ